MMDDQSDIEQPDIDSPPAKRQKLGAFVSPHSPIHLTKTVTATNKHIASAEPHNSGNYDSENQAKSDVESSEDDNEEDEFTPEGDLEPDEVSSDEDADDDEDLMDLDDDAIRGRFKAKVPLVVAPRGCLHPTKTSNRQAMPVLTSEPSSSSSWVLAKKDVNCHTVHTPIATEARPSSSSKRQRNDTCGTDKPSKRQRIFDSESVECTTTADNKDHLNSKARRKLERAAPALTTIRCMSTSNSAVGDASNDLPDDPEWPDFMHLRGTKLKTQHILLRQLCCKVIKIVHCTLVMMHAWPELNRLSEYRNEVLTKASRLLQWKDDRYIEIRCRIKKDERFTMILGKLVMDRLSCIRGPVCSRGLDHIAVFQLSIGDICIERVQALLANDTYIYPGKWGTDNKGKQFWIIKANEPYLNSGLIAVLKTAFFGMPTVFGYRFKAKYISSHPTHLEPELPASLVALASTGLYAGIHAWQSGKKGDTERFEGETFKTVFDLHLEYLKDMKETNAIAYHVIMNHLYVHVINATACGELPKKKGSALAVADLSEFV